MSRVEVWRTLHAQNILYMLGQVFPDIDAGEMQLRFSEENHNAADEISSEWMEVRDNSMISLPTESSLLTDIRVLMILDAPHEDSPGGSRNKRGRDIPLDSKSVFTQSEREK